VTGAEDLLQDAIAKTLDGRRRWNRRVTMIKHLDRVMESDAGHEAERRVARAPEKEVDRIVAPSASEARLVALGEIQEVLSLFADDRPALELLRAKGNGLSASEVQRTLGIGASDYETITRRIRRRFARRMAAGDK
jgi:DNA-directed RNA polymerase specialized sigma24 family protein